MRIMIPLELAPYIRLRDGKIIFKKELPPELRNKFQEFKEEYETILADKANEAKKNILEK